jgi:hypothetical protein
MQRTGGERTPSRRLLQPSERQVQRLKRRYRTDFRRLAHHGNRARPMAWAVSVPQKQLILSLARGEYRGCNDFHLAENLRAEEASPSAARPCAASCGQRNWLLRRSDGRVNATPADRPPALRRTPRLHFTLRQDKRAA